jgi:hydrogenase maturation factor HypF (carbamoyltransferase family)
MKNPSIFACVGVCPLCGQGRQVIARENTSGKLYVLCEDCEAEWQNPTDAREIDRASRDTFGISTLLTSADLSDHPWKGFVEGVQ